MQPFEEEKNDPRSIAELIETALLEEELPHYEERPTRAAVALEARGSAEVLEAMRELCRSPDPKRRAFACAILGELGLPDRTFPEECCDILLDMLASEQDSEVLSSVVYAFGHLGNSRAVPDLIKFKNHDDPDIRRGVAFSLNGETSAEVVQTLLELMEDPHEGARDWATTGIGHHPEIDGPEIREALWRRASDSSHFVRAEALAGLARREDRRVVLRLIAELADEDTYVTDVFETAAMIILGHGEFERSMSKSALLKELRKSLVVR